MEEVLVVLTIVAATAGLYWWATVEANAEAERERDLFDDGGER